jgi:hypothetical protein
MPPFQMGGDHKFQRRLAGIEMVEWDGLEFFCKSTSREQSSRGRRWATIFDGLTDFLLTLLGHGCCRTKQA